MTQAHGCLECGVVGGRVQRLVFPPVSEKGCQPSRCLLGFGPFRVFDCKFYDLLQSNYWNLIRKPKVDAALLALPFVLYFFVSKLFLIAI